MTSGSIFSHPHLLIHMAKSCRIMEVICKNRKCLFLTVGLLIVAVSVLFLSHSNYVVLVTSTDNIQQEHSNQLVLSELSEMLHFVKIRTGYCDGILEPFNSSNPTFHKGFDTYLQQLQGYQKEVLKRRKKEKIEGYTALWQMGTLVYWHLAKLPFVKTVCETGFNAGHSSFLWLSTNPQMQVYSFDISRHKYSRKMASYLQDRFPGRLNVTWGDSTVTLPLFHMQNPNIKCDLLFIDGGHTVKVAQSDLDTYKLMANPVHIVMMDDHPALHITHGDNGPRTVWEEAKLKGEVHEFAACSNTNEMRGVAFGHFINQEI